ncbi:MAG TPA: hypothetical protein VF126_17050 [Acidobacteriaceae bacterium]
MSLWAWLDLEGRDIFAFTVAGVLGFLLGRMMPHGPLAVFTSMLVSYHLFLGWLVLTAEHESGFSMPILSTIVTHLAFMMVVIALGIGRRIIPYFGIFRYLIAGLAIFERGWLFQSNTVKLEPPEPAPPALKIQSTPADEEAWLQYLAQQRPGLPKKGDSLRAEHEKWMLARIASRAVSTATDRESAG